MVIRRETLIKTVLFLARCAAGGIFAYAGWGKLMRPVQEFQYVIEQYQLFPRSIVRLASHVLPWYELVFGIFLILGFMRAASARALWLLCFSFLLLLVSTMIRGIDIGHCGCFGEGIHLSIPQAITLDSSLLIAFTFFSLVRDHYLEIDSWFQRHH